MKIVVGMATFEGREQSLQVAINSLENQVDEIYLYDNEVQADDLTDNGKFYGLKMLEEPAYYLTCDDDLMYPPDYVEKMVQAIDELGGIVTHHGRELKGLGLDYYWGHNSFRCLGDNHISKIIDVCGTGVSGFRTDVFNPTELWNHERQKMSDLIFSLEAAKQRIKITVLPHKAGWIRQLKIDFSKCIHETESKNCGIQNRIADEIYTLNHGKG